jgi:protein-disulfide isomerase
MKKIIVLALVLLLASCSADAELKKELEALKKSYEQLVAALNFRGFNLEETIAEMDLENKIHEIPIGKSPVIGPENAPITIVEFSDFQCPHCARAVSTVDQLHEKYPDKIRFVYKRFPLSMQGAGPAAAAASMAAQAQGKFWEFRTLLAPHFRELTPERFLEAAEKAGLDMDRFRQDMVMDKEKYEWMQKDRQLGVEIGVRGTPSFYINGKKSTGLNPNQIEEMIRNL